MFQTIQKNNYDFYSLKNKTNFSSRYANYIYLSNQFKDMIRKLCNLHKSNDLLMNKSVFYGNMCRYASIFINFDTVVLTKGNIFIICNLHTIYLFQQNPEKIQTKPFTVQAGCKKNYRNATRQLVLFAPLLTKLQGAKWSH